MNKLAPKFYLPTKSLTGRMDHSKPTIQMLPMPMNTPWQQELDKIRNLSQQSTLNGKVFTVSRQQQIKPGDLVVWGPTGAPGLWFVTDVHHPYKGIGADADYRSIERSLANLSPEAQAVYEMKYKRKRKPNSVRSGNVRLEWFAGWAGYTNDGLPVAVKIEDVRRPNEMEVVALAAS